ncbi:MAG: hypothetical protein IJ759_06765 [Bacteroidales bacterium]|nr:hypothetical protein [Bacteroidales bacterium]
MKTLHLVLKKQWFDMIASGEKTEEYREIKPYWQKRICINCNELYCERPCLDCYRNDMNTFNHYDTVTFYLGYKKDRPKMTFKIRYISVGYGKEEWGAEKGKVYFVIKLGERIN